MDTPFGKHEYPNFVLALSQFIQQPQFRCLHFYAMLMPPSCMQLLLHTFFATPCSHEQHLIFDYVDMKEGRLSSTAFQCNQSIKFPESNIDSKHLQISACTGPQWVFCWLFSYSHLRFNSLRIGDIVTYDSIQALDGTQAFDCLTMAHLNLQVQNLHLEYTFVKIVPTKMRDSTQLIKLIESPALKSLTFEGKTIGCLFPYLLQGLQRRQYPLHSLALSCTEIGKQADEPIEHFFNVVYSSTPLSEFELHLENNGFLPRHFEMMYQSWKRECCGKKLKSLTFKEEDVFQDVRLVDMCNS